MIICIRCGKNVEKARISKNKICEECHNARSEKNKKNSKITGKDMASKS